MIDFYRGSCTFRSFFFAILTPPPILEISAPSAIGGISIATVHPFKFFMTHTKAEIPTF
jgi:hypothetical protein